MQDANKPFVPTADDIKVAFNREIGKAKWNFWRYPHFRFSIYPPLRASMFAPINSEEAMQPTTSYFVGEAVHEVDHDHFGRLKAWRITTKHPTTGELIVLEQGP